MRSTSTSASRPRHAQLRPRAPIPIAPLLSPPRRVSRAQRVGSMHRPCAHARLMSPLYAARMAGTVIAAIASAFITGALARFAVPGPDPMPAWLTVAIGLGGTVLGGGIVLAVAGQDPAWVGIAGFLASIALVLL